MSHPRDPSQEMGVETQPIQYIYAIKSNSMADYFRFGGIEYMKRIQTPCTSCRTFQSLHSVFMVVPTLDYDKDMAQIKHSFRSKSRTQGWYFVQDSEVRDYFNSYILTGFQTDIQELYDKQPEKTPIPCDENNRNTSFWKDCVKNIGDYQKTNIYQQNTY